MRPALLTPMRLLCGIAAFTILCMVAVAAVTDHLANIYLSSSTVAPASRVHLIDDVTQTLKRAQECRREYLLTGDTSYLDAYRAACSDAGVSMDRLLSGDHEVTENLVHPTGLRQFMHAKLSILWKKIGLAHTADSPAAMPAVDGDLARTQKLLDSLAQKESSDISNELEAAEARTIFHRDLVFALAVINILFLGGVAFCASQIGKLYSLITICAWSKRVRYQGTWMPMEEYMCKRFGIRITHSISQEEYDKWFASEGAGAPLTAAPFPNHAVPPGEPAAGQPLA
jgi:CHASE3 domain sensor protein